MNKNELRIAMRQKRKQLTKEEVHEKSIAISNKLFALEQIQQAKTVMVYMDSFKEPETMPFICYLQQHDIRVIVPITNLDTGLLTLSYVTAEWKTGAYGIKEPLEIVEADEKTIDVILVPGLAFDKNGNRMGFGKGYYDKLLANTNAFFIGICYDFQLLDMIPTDTFDIPMHMVITEKREIKGVKE